MLSQLIAASAIAGERKAPRSSASTAAGKPLAGNPLDRIAYAVDGAESSHGADEAMWRTDPAGPQGPMQVSAAAASDVGGGDRFDEAQNRELGRAYLAQLYHRYGNWPDAVAAYDWGIGNFDAWVKAGRPASGVVFGVVAYLGRVLHDSGICQDSSAKPARKRPAAPESCADLAAWGGVASGGRVLSGGSKRFYGRLDQAMQLAAQHAHTR